MWEMLDSDLECGSECGGPGPPPEFVIPPPPRPPFLHDVASCSEEPLPNIEMCEAIPILDPSYHSSPSLQTSALIVLCSVVLVLVVLISSLLVWKHKRKVQNFLPCKTPTRGGHMDATAVSGGHSVTYEDPDAHLGSRPLVIRHQHNMEMLHPKSIHFPSGYPMTRSPPLFVCSSPGPDPYRSHDNVYEELGPPRESDGESEPPVHSDDDFAEDELSLPGERSFHKTSPDTSTVATIYQERGASSGTAPTSSGSGASGNGERSTNERNTLLSPPATSASGRSTGSRGVMASPGSIFRGRKVHSTRNGKLPNFSADELNTSSEHDYTSEMVLPTIYGQRSHLMTLPYNTTAPTPANRSSRSNTMNCFAASTISTEGEDNEVERRNQINRELSNPVATIFRERVTPPYQRNFLTHHHPPARTRTNPRSLDRRRIIAPAPSGHVIPDPGYGYAEPVFHDGLLYDPYLAHDRTHPYPYILPEFTTFRNAPGAVPCQDGTVAGAAPSAVFGRDSSFGSDSGYSQHTQTSTRSGWGRSGRRESAPKNTPFSAS